MIVSWLNQQESNHKFNFLKVSHGCLRSIWLCQVLRARKSINLFTFSLAYFEGLLQKYWLKFI